MLNKKKILFLYDSTVLGGAERSLLYFVKNLNRKKFCPIVVLPDKGFLFRQLDSLDIDVRLMEIRRLRKTVNLFKLFNYLLHLLRVASQLRLLINTEGIKIIHANSLSAQIQVNFVRGIKNIPKIWHVRDVFPHYWSIRLSIKYAALHTTKIVAISKAVRDNLVKMGISENKIIVIYNGIDFGEIKKVSHTNETVRRKLKVGGDCCIVGMIGSISHSKGQDIFIQAAYMVLKEFPDTFFVIVGGYFPENQLYYHQMRQLVEKLRMKEKVIFLEPVEEIEELICSLDIVVNMSREREGLGRSILEAMAFGKPVVGTKIGGIPELVDQDCGILIDSGNVNELFEKLCFLIKDKDLRVKMGENGKKKIEKSFNIKLKVKELEEVFDLVLA
jgi:glycosyltransferase involved in cell wall biosynthesis